MCICRHPILSWPMKKNWIYAPQSNINYIIFLLNTSKNYSCTLGIFTLRWTMWDHHYISNSRTNISNVNEFIKISHAREVLRFNNTPNIQCKTPISSVTLYLQPQNFKTSVSTPLCCPPLSCTAMGCSACHVRARLHSGRLVILEMTINTTRFYGRWSIVSLMCRTDSFWLVCLCMLQNYVN